MPAPKASQRGRALAAEFVGTALVMWVVLTVKLAALNAGPPYSGLQGRVTLIGVFAGLAVIAVVYSPLGRCSGGHLNPAFTLGLWRLGKIGTGDAAAYCVAQLAGGTAGFAAARIWGGHVAGPDVAWATISPAPSVDGATALVIEILGTFAQFAVVYAFLGSARLRASAGAAAGVLLGVCIVILAPLSGGAFNPVRGLGPDFLTGYFPSAWIYVVGPLLGAAAAAEVVAVAHASVRSPRSIDPAPLPGTPTERN